MPEDWRPKAVENVKDLRKLFQDAEVEVMLNADQTIVKFYIEEECIIAPTGTKRVGGRIKADAKAGFTLMVIVNLATSEVEAPFIVFTGTKLSDAVRPESVSHFYLCFHVLLSATNVYFRPLRTGI